MKFLEYTSITINFLFGFAEKVPENGHLFTHGIFSLLFSRKINMRIVFGFDQEKGFLFYSHHPTQNKNLLNGNLNILLFYNHVFFMTNSENEFWRFLFPLFSVPKINKCSQFWERLQNYTWIKIKKWFEQISVILNFEKSDTTCEIFFNLIFLAKFSNLKF